MSRQKDGKFHWRVPEREKSQADDRPNLVVGKYQEHTVEATIPAKYTFSVGSDHTTNTLASMQATISRTGKSRYMAQLKTFGLKRYAIENGKLIDFETLTEAMDWCEQNALSFAREVFVAAKFVLDAVEGNYSEVGTPFDMEAQKETVGKYGQSDGNGAVSDD